MRSLKTLSLPSLFLIIGSLACACEDKPLPLSDLMDQAVETPLDREVIDPNGGDVDGGDVDGGLGSQDSTLEDMGEGLSDTGIELDAEPPFSLPNIEGGNPLNPEVGLYPYPSDYFLQEAPQTVTGYQVNIPEQLMPSSLPAEAFDGHDGFSRLPMILSAWPRGIDRLSLPSSENLGESIADTSSTFIIHHQTGTRVPHIAEIDLMSDDPLRRALILRPAIVLKANASYTVVIRSNLKDLEGSSYEMSEAFMALKMASMNTEITGFEPLDIQIPKFMESKAVIEQSGIDFESVILTWSFHTRSEEQLTGDLLTMQEQAASWPLTTYEVTEDNVDATNRIIRGVFEMPLYVGERGLERDESGHPIAVGVAQYPFSMAIPRTVDEPRPIIIYGHGFLGDHPQAVRSSFNDLCVSGRFNAIGMNFGMHSGVLPLLIRALTGDLNAFHLARAEVMQTMINYTIMTRYLRDQLSLEYPELDPQRIVYMGISNGGTFGYLYSATSTLIEQAVLVVGGAGLSHFLQRATQWNNLGLLVTQEFDDPLELQLYLAMLQEQLDPVDPINYVDHLISPRFEGRRPLRAQLHMAVHDSQVHNMVTEWVARSANIPLMTPSPKPIWGLDTIEAPLSERDQLDLSSAMIVYDEQVTPYLEGNQPQPEDNGTHGTVRRLESYRRHIIDFIEEGLINQVCDGACDPE